MRTNQHIIIVAGGKGLRVGSEIPKQFIPIGGKPVLMHAIEAFYNYNKQINIVLVLPESHQEYWRELCSKYNFTVEHSIAIGGETRFHSVKNGLALVSDGLVGVHDGARPFASRALIKSCYDKAFSEKAAIPVNPSTDSLRELLDDGKSRIVDRSKYVSVQTPQVFETSLLKKAYESDYKEIFTDDASVVEAMGVEVSWVRGEDTNIKITTPIDLKIGELILQEKKMINNEDVVKEFVKQFYKEMLFHKDRCTNPQIIKKKESLVSKLREELDLSEAQLPQFNKLIETLLTDVFFTILLGLDGETAIGDYQCSYKLIDEEGNDLSGGNIEAYAYEYFHSNLYQEESRQ